MGGDTKEERKANWAAIGCGVDFPGRTAFGNPEYEDQECYFTSDKINLDNEKTMFLIAYLKCHQPMIN